MLISILYFDKNDLLGHHHVAKLQYHIWQHFQTFFSQLPLNAPDRKKNSSFEVVAGNYAVAY